MQSQLVQPSTIRDTAKLNASSPGALRALTAWFQLQPTSSPTEAARLTDDLDRDVYRLAGAGPGGEPIIAKKCSCDEAAQERLAYTQILPNLRLEPTLRYFGDVPDSDGKCWMFVEDAGPGAYDMGSPRCRRIAGTWLGRFHASAMIVGKHPSLCERGTAWFESMLDECRSLVVDVQTAAFLTKDDRRALQEVRACCDRLATRREAIHAICAATPSTVTHGDLAGRNMRVRETLVGPTLVVFDWPDVAWGPPAIDLVISTDQTATDTASPDLEAYCAAVSVAWPDVTRGRVETLAKVGELFWHVFALRLDAASIEPGYVERPISHMADYCNGIMGAMSALGWNK
ncbi:phosphotransferase [Humisphaera borealis]|uniref:Phosphotransferase n=1 Tax=Humisphaera borealis TaxID=2807512 RepID=A0A7M2WXB8_9BACT|nr:phosphotransferase [Humisphaera borealis]QOV90178.1 phosphotransferase [Humisphaera borealis]